MFKSFFEAKGTIAEYNAGDVIVDCDNPPSHVYMIKSGYVKVSVISTRGNEHLLIFYKSGEIFPARWAFAGIKGCAFYTATTPVSVVKVEKSEFKDFEDAIQYNCALSMNKIEFIVTRDTKDFKTSTVPILTPKEANSLIQNSTKQ